MRSGKVGEHGAMAVRDESTDDDVTLRDIAPAAFLPPALFAVGQGAIAPVVVISATDLGASPAMAALVVATAGLGQIVADIPAGTIVHRFGERPTMIGAAVLTVLALLGCIFAPNLAVFALCDLRHRLRHRGLAAGPAGLRHRGGALPAAGHGDVDPRRGVPDRAVHRSVHRRCGRALHRAVGCLRGAHRRRAGRRRRVVPGQGPVDGQRGATGHAATAGSPVGRMVREQRSVFATLGIGVLVVSAIRAARQVVLPLWGQHLGLSPAAISVIFGISGAIDMLFFYPAGKVMDRYGRAWVAIPSMAVLGISLLLVPLAQTTAALLLVGLLMGVGNGMSSGLVMTLGADLAPPGQRPVFLGVWRMFADSGNGVGPFVIAGITAAATLGVGIAAMGAVGLLGAGWLGFWIPRRVPPVRRSVDRTAEPHV